mmetsp:Transcript_8004/g.12239  ORF Transcript_8004/g.12239 Transcript_8004/m.12239 type:complete len:246 (-) Transcript_8004:1112-1849(-)
MWQGVVSQEGVHGRVHELVRGIVPNAQDEVWHASTPAVLQLVREDAAHNHPLVQAAGHDLHGAAHALRRHVQGLQGLLQLPQQLFGHDLAPLRVRVEVAPADAPRLLQLHHGAVGVRGDAVEYGQRHVLDFVPVNAVVKLGPHPSLCNLSALPTTFHHGAAECLLFPGGGLWAVPRPGVGHPVGGGQAHLGATAEHLGQSLALHGADHKHRVVRVAGQLLDEVDDGLPPLLALGERHLGVVLQQH